MFGRRGLVGVDIGHYYTKVVYLEDKKGSVSLVRVFKERTPEGVISTEGCDEIVLGDFLQYIFSEYRVKNKNVAFGLNSSFVITKTLKVPLVVDEEIEQAVMWEAEQYAPVSIDDVNVSYQVLRKDREKNEMSILIAITKKDIIESYKTAFKRAKLKLEVVDVDVFATSNAYFFANPGGKGKHNLIVDLGYSSTKMIFLRNGMPMFTRYMDFNFSNVLNEAKEILEIKDEEVERLIREPRSEKKESLVAFFNDKLFNLYSQIQNSITFYNSGVLDIAEPVENIVFAGALGVLYEHLNIESVREFLKAEISQFNPLEFVGKEDIENLEDIVLGASSVYCVATGLSLRGIERD